MTETALDKARRAWGKELPNWIDELARLCDLSGMRRTSVVLEYSHGAISQVINRKYPGDLKKVETAVRGRVMNMTVDCPVMDHMWVDMCAKNQADVERGLGDGMFMRMCPGCPNANLRKPPGRPRTKGGG